MKLPDELVSILELVSMGLSNKEISVKLNYSTRTVERRIKKLFGIYKVNSRILLAQEFLAEKL
jgi:DNA-binding NarL/FixJ family response regulator